MTKLKDLDLPVVSGRCYYMFLDRRKRKLVRLPHGKYVPLSMWRNIKRLLRSKDASVELFDDRIMILYCGGHLKLHGADLD